MEEWRAVVGFEGFYEVSDQGRVRSLPRTIRYADGRIREYPGVTLTPRKMPRGNMDVTLRGSKNYAVHRLVADAFLPPVEGTEVCHNNGDFQDNRLMNLRRDTHAENMLDITRHGHSPKRNQETCHRGHRLAGENLRKAPALRGLRECRSCAAGRSYVSRHPGTDLQEESDRYYRLYVGS